MLTSVKALRKVHNFSKQSVWKYFICWTSTVIKTDILCKVTQQHGRSNTVRKVLPCNFGLPNARLQVIFPSSLKSRQPSLMPEGGWEQLTPRFIILPCKMAIGSTTCWLEKKAKSIQRKLPRIMKTRTHLVVDTFLFKYSDRQIWLNSYNNLYKKSENPGLSMDHSYYKSKNHIAPFLVCN